MESTELKPAKNKLNIVIINHSKADCFLFSGMLENCHAYEFNIQEYASSNEFYSDLKKLRAQDIDLIIFECSKYESKEKALIKSFKSLFPGVAILATRERFKEELAIELGKAGVIGILEKDKLDDANLVNTVIHTINLSSNLKNSIIKANYDPLTHLANRTLLYERMSHAISLCKRSNKAVALMLIDLDDFKLINDHYGHDVGDTFLQKISQRLKDTVRVTDTVARIGGDEFAILLEGVEYTESTVQLAKKIIKTINEPVFINNKKIIPSLSIGIAYLLNRDRFSYDWLYQSADTALYQAKKNGKNTYSIFTDTQDTKMLNELKLEDELADAIKSRSFCLYYQPIFDVNNHKLCGTEALLRWKKNDGKIVSPDHFLDKIEKLGLMKELGDFVVDSSLSQYAKWKKRYSDDISIHINISPAQFSSEGFCETLKKHIDHNALPATQIKLELTEQNLFKNTKFLEKEFNNLNRLGVKLAIDDFGVGYSSYDYIRRFQFEALKLDKSFVNSMFKNSIDMAIIKSVTKFAKNLNINVIAEGVETQKQLDSLAEIGVDQIQGYYKGKPVPANMFESQFLFNYENMSGYSSVVNH